MEYKQKLVTQHQLYSKHYIDIFFFKFIRLAIEKLSSVHSLVHESHFTMNGSFIEMMMFDDMKTAFSSATLLTLLGTERATQFATRMLRSDMSAGII